MQKNHASIWDAGQKIAVLCAVDEDYGKGEMNGRDNMECPVCKMPSMKYRRTSLFHMTAWCTNCKTGVTQDGGA